MRVIPDDQNNAVLVYGTERELGTMEAMLRKIDILPLQVRIDAVIAEVTLNDVLQYGTQFFFKSGGINSILNTGTRRPRQPSASTASLNLAFPGFFLGGNGAGGAPFAIQALQQVTTVHVLSSPELLVLDNQPARLQVGSVVPYLSQTSQSTITANAPVVSSINYQQTGVIMEVTPRVNSGGLVTLDVMQDVSSVATGITTPGINSPTFNERNVNSRVVVQDGQTIGLAGLITDTTSLGNQGIPWLKDVPILGLLAGNQNNTRQRTELLILITPHVIHDQRDARALTEDLAGPIDQCGGGAGHVEQPASVRQIRSIRGCESSCSCNNRRIGWSCRTDQAVARNPAGCIRSTGCRFPDRRRFRTALRSTDRNHARPGLTDLDRHRDGSRDRPAHCPSRTDRSSSARRGLLDQGAQALVGGRIAADIQFIHIEH